jgi:hypothetical protein
MKGALFAIGVAAAGSSQLTESPKSLAAQSERATVNLVVRYVRERIVSCEEPKTQYFRRKPACRAERRGSSGSAKVELIPMPDARRDIFGTDKRERLVLDLKYDNRPVEQSVKIGQGPWLLNWKGTEKSLRFDVETNDEGVALNTMLGACKALMWHCKLDPTVTSNRIERRDIAAGPHRN